MISGVTPRAQVAPAPWTGARSVPWMLRLLLVAVAFGMVLLHQELVAAHQHVGDAGTEHSAPISATAEAATNNGDGPSAVPTLVASPAQVAAPASPETVTVPRPDEALLSFLHGHHDIGHEAATRLDDCLTALTAAVLLALMLYLAARRQPPERARSLFRPRSSDVAHPPAVSLRLAQLQVLRL